MESTATAEPVSQPSLNTLPRETRNQIYSYLVVSSKPIKVCYGYDSSCLDLRTGRQNKDISIEFLCHAVEGSELAQEAYEEFFRNNIFDCGSCEILRRFLTTTTTRFNFQKNLVPNTTKHGYLKFEKKPWIRKVNVSILFDDFEGKPPEHLAYLLQCPYLRQVEITIFGLTSGGYKKTDSVDWNIEAIARVCKSIRGKIGGGLIVKVQKDWELPGLTQNVMIDKRYLENVSWMWEEPSEEARKGLGTHKGKIQVLMSSGWDRKEEKVGAWAEHWRQENNEQQRIQRIQRKAERELTRVRILEHLRLLEHHS